MFYFYFITQRLKIIAVLSYFTTHSIAILCFYAKLKKLKMTQKVKNCSEHCLTIITLKLQKKSLKCKLSPIYIFLTLLNVIKWIFYENVKPYIKKLKCTFFVIMPHSAIPDLD